MKDQDNGNATGASAPLHGIPPYIPFPTFETLLKQLKQDGLPPQIDKSVLAKFAGGTQSQLKVALRAMGLMEDNRPTDDLALLVEALDTPDFEPLLKSLLERTYPYVFALDLMTATPTMFAEAFKATGAKEDVSRKCRTFFLHAAKRAGVPLGNRILSGSVPRSSNGAKRRPRKAKEQDEQGAQTPTTTPTQTTTTITDKALEYKLIDLMREEGVEDAERSAIWTLVQYLTAKAKKEKAAGEEPAA